MTADALAGGVVNASSKRTCRVQAMQQLRPMLTTCPWLSAGVCQYDGQGALNGELGCAAAIGYGTTPQLAGVS